MARQSDSHQSLNTSELGCHAVLRKGHHIGIEARHGMAIEPERVMEFTRNAVHTADGLAPGGIIACGLFYSWMRHASSTYVVGRPLLTQGPGPHAATATVESSGPTLSPS